MDVKDIDRACVLAFCNQAREKLGRKPVTNLRRGGHESWSCPVANTINYQSRNCVDISVVRMEMPDGDYVSLPQCVRDFVRVFDDESPGYEAYTGEGWAA